MMNFRHKRSRLVLMTDDQAPEAGTMRCLQVANVASMIYGFNMRNIDILQNLGWVVAVATNFTSPGPIPAEDAVSARRKLEASGVETYQIDFPRGVGSLMRDARAIGQLTRLRRQGDFARIHAHSALGGALTRLAFMGSLSEIIYTAHGFRFFEGGPWADWLLYYPVERFLSRVTDTLITINSEDAKLASAKFHAGKVVRIPGVGIDWQRLRDSVSTADRCGFRDHLGIPHAAVLMVSVWELSVRKNHITAIRAMAKVGRDNLYYVICGMGNQQEALIHEIQRLGLENRVTLVGYADNPVEFYAASDFSLLLSRQEGLGLSGLEAMACGLPIIASDLGGVKDYLDGGASGVAIKNPVDANEVADAIVAIMDMEDAHRNEIDLHNVALARQFDMIETDQIMRAVYGSDLGGR